MKDAWQLLYMAVRHYMLYLLAVDCGYMHLVTGGCMYNFVDYKDIESDNNRHC